MLTVCRRLGLIVAEDERIEPVGGGLVHAGDDVLVGVGGEGKGVVAEPFLDDLDVDAAFTETAASRACGEDPEEAGSSAGRSRSRAPAGSC